MNGDKMNILQWAWGLIFAPLLHLYATKADKEDLHLKADKTTVEEMSKTLHDVDRKMDELLVALVPKK